MQGAKPFSLKALEYILPAINDMEVCFIPKEEIIRDLKSNTNFSMSVLKEMADSLKEADNIIVDMAQKTAKQRLAETLLFLKNLMVLMIHKNLLESNYLERKLAL